MSKDSEMLYKAAKEAINQAFETFICPLCGYDLERAEVDLLICENPGCEVMWEKPQDGEKT